MRGIRIWCNEYKIINYRGSKCLLPRNRYDLIYDGYSLLDNHLIVGIHAKKELIELFRLTF